MRIILMIGLFVYAAVYALNVSGQPRAIKEVWVVGVEIIESDDYPRPGAMTGILLDVLSKKPNLVVGYIGPGGEKNREKFFDEANVRNRIHLISFAREFGSCVRSFVVIKPAGKVGNKYELKTNIAMTGENAAEKCATTHADSLYRDWAIRGL